ncbi:MAG: tetratricopeptide repeat protein [Synechococcaceae cyanobacterium SM2_3_2]|nr:tetratricopeptide repeat protein [Synechococcaceae cyanobacterium SM2_3_2]
MNEPTVPTEADYVHILESCLERGSYRRALELSLEALAHHPQSGSLKIWRAVCLESLGRTSEAVTFLRPLLRAGDVETAKQARYLLSIWEAPRLRRPQNWTVEIPDLSHLSGGDWNLTAVAPAPRKPKISQPKEPSQVRSGLMGSQWRQRVVWVSVSLVLALWAFTRIGLIP